MPNEKPVYFISTRRGELFIFDPDKKYNLKSVVRDTVINGLIRSELMTSAVVPIRAQFACMLVASSRVVPEALSLVRIAGFDSKINMSNLLTITAYETDVLHKIEKSNNVMATTRPDIILIESPFTFLQLQEHLYNES